MAAAVDWERFSEAMNPIVVKEIRQGLRTRVFWICFGLLLVACFVIALVAWGISLESQRSRAEGPAFFFAFFLCMGLVQFFIIPYTAYRSLAREREDETWVLLSLTGMGAKRILRGKVGSYLVQAALYGSAVLPFIFFSYYLNGIDLPTILTVVALGAAWTLFLICISVCAATLAETRLFRGLTHFLVLGALIAATILGLSIAGTLTFNSSRLFRDDTALVGLGIAVWLMVAVAFLLYQTAAARLALPTEDHARGPRVALLVLLGGSAVGFGVLWQVENHQREIALVAQALFCLAVFGVGLFLMSGLDAPHEGHFRARRFPLFRPGSVAAFRFLVMVVGLITSLWTVIWSVSRDSADRGHELVFILACGAYVLLYLAAPVVLARVTNLWPLKTAVGLRGLTLVLLAAGVGLPPLGALILGLRPEDDALNLFNPVIGPTRFVRRSWMDGATDERMVMLAVLSGVALVLALLAERSLARNEQALRAARTR